MTHKNYEILEHTADIRILVKAKKLRELFQKSAMAMFDLIAVKKWFIFRKAVRFDIMLKADTLEELYVDWLNDLLSLSESKKLVFTGFKIAFLSDNRLRGFAYGYDRRKFIMKREIKAATYHDLKIENRGDIFFSEIIFDV